MLGFGSCAILRIRQKRFAKIRRNKDFNSIIISHYVSVTENNIQMFELNLQMSNYHARLLK